MATDQRFGSFAEFYPYYLREHSHPTCRRLHVLGTTLVLVALAAGAVTASWAWVASVPFLGYGPAWAGHFFFEKNRPATFRYPFYSLAGDFRMYWETVTGRLAF
jgi:hypothetical protein